MAVKAAPEPKADATRQTCGRSQGELPAAYLSGQVADRLQHCASEESPSVPFRKPGAIFTDQLWKVKGMVKQPLPWEPLEVPDNRGRAPLRISSSGGSLSRLLSGGSIIGGDASRSSGVSSAACVSLSMPAKDLNPKSLKMAAIKAYEASQNEGSDVSAAMSDSTGVSPSWLPPPPPDSHQRLQTGAGSARLPGPGAAQHAQHGAACHTQHQLATASSVLSGMKGEGTSPWAPEQLQECLLCGVATVPPAGPLNIRCSTCRGAMHKECFVAHYGVVPGRRDWTYCPAHSLSAKACKPKPVLKQAARRGGRAGKPTAAGHKRSRSDSDGSWGPAPHTGRGGGPGFSAVPSASRSQRLRRNSSRESPHGDGAAADEGRRESEAAQEADEAAAAAPPATASSRPRRAVAARNAAVSAAVKAEAESDAEEAEDGSAAAAADASDDWAPAGAARRQRVSATHAAVEAAAAPASESGSAAEPESPPAAARPLQPQPPPRLSVSVRRSSGAAAAAASSIRSPKSPRVRTPRSPAAARRGTAHGGGSGSRQSLPSPQQTPRALPETPQAPSVAKTSAELADEELALLLHQELNAPTRHRGRHGSMTPATPAGLGLGL